METHCASCGMPLGSKEDMGSETGKGPVCKFCVNPDGSVKSCEEVFEGGVKFFMSSVPGTDRKLAERITRKNMRSQPLWKGSDSQVLRGEEATDEEFREVLSKLHGEIKKGNVKG